MAVCETFDPDCYGCQLRAKSIAVSDDAMPNRRDSRPFVPPRRANPTWERGVAGERRADGSFMPILDTAGGRMGVKAYSENRHQVEERVRQLKTDPNVFTRKD